VRHGGKAEPGSDPGRGWDDYQHMRENTTASPFLTETLTFSSFEPGFYIFGGRWEE